MGEMIVREMRADEAKRVFQIGKQAFVGIESLWVAKPKQALVIIKDDTIVGAVLYKYIMSGNKKIGYIDYAFIDPKYHHQGIGSKLYKSAVDYLWQQGCDALSAVVKDDNVGSWGLFLKYGFSRVSVREMTRLFGIWGMLRQYFGTPFCFGVGMEYYVAMKDDVPVVDKVGGWKEVLGFMLANVLFLVPPIALGMWGANVFYILGAYILMLVVGVMAEGLATRLSPKHEWKFRVNNGGALVCAMTNFGCLFPMVGSFYPKNYEKSEVFRRDMGRVALASWVTILGVIGITLASGMDHVFIKCIQQVSAFLVWYRILAFYPFEGLGGGRVYQWNRLIYGIMALLSIGGMYLIFR